MKKISLFFVFIFLTRMISVTQAQNPSYAWGLKVDKRANNHYSIKTDAQNNTYMMGVAIPGTDFDPSAATVTVTTKGPYDIYLAKYDYQGNFLWVRTMGSKFWDEARDIDLDAAGNVYITGLSQTAAASDTFFLQTSTSTYTIYTGSYLGTFVTKYDAAGNNVWCNLIKGTGNVGAAPTGLDISATGYLTLTGLYSGTVDFDPSSTNSSVLPVGGTGDDNIFVARYNLNGNYVWAKGLTGVNNIYIEQHGIKTDAAGNSYICGVYTAGHIDFDPSPTATVSPTGPTGNVYGYIAKYDVSGNYVWAKFLGANGSSNAINPYGLAVDASGNTYITGLVENMPDFDPSPATYILNGNSGNIFIAKYDASGNLAWAKSMTSNNQDWGNSIDLDNSGSLYTTGYLTGTADFDPSPTVTQTLTPTGTSSAFVSKYDTSGNYVWAALINTDMPGAASAQDIHIGTNGSIYVCGTFKGVVDLDLSSSVVSFTSATANNTDQFLVRYNQCTASTSSTITASSCGNYILNGQTYTSGGSYQQFLTNTAGCDSLLTLNLTINQPSSASITHTSCNSYMANSQTYTASGVYTQTLTNSKGCDSLLTLNLTINQPSNASITHTACNNYLINSQTYTASGVYTQTLSNSVGCDSILTINLTINTINASITTNGLVLTANESGASYQWIDCNNNNQPISGANSQSYTVTANGNYAVEIVKNSCTSTSACTAISSVGMHEASSANVRVFPNPGNGVVFLENLERVASVTVVDVLGKELVNTQTHSPSIDLNLSEYGNGVYFLKLQFKDNSVSVQRILIEK